MSDENGNEFIRGIETRACVNGMTKSDVEKLKDALVKKILDDKTVIEITENGKVIADSDGLKIQMNGLEVEGYNQLTSGKVKLLPISTGAKVEFTDSDQRSISLTHGHDGDKSFLRVYPNTYYPVDSNENPVAPNSDVLMTSGLVGVDPRIVHTTGNEEIGGQKTFTENLKTTGTNGTVTIDDSGRITYHQSNPDSTAMAGLEYDEEQEQTYMYAPSYLPVDSDENPQVPYDDIVLTSMNLAVDPRIVHTTGNEVVAGSKNFTATPTVSASNIKIQEISSYQTKDIYYLKDGSATPVTLVREKFECSATANGFYIELSNSDGNGGIVKAELHMSLKPDGNVRLWLRKPDTSVVDIIPYS